MINLPQYTKKDAWIFLAVCIPHAIFLNCLLFGTRYFLEITVLAAASVVTFIIMSISWHLHTWVAVTLRNRFSDSELIKRIIIAIILFNLMTAITITILFYSYNYFHFMGYELEESNYN